MTGGRHNFNLIDALIVVFGSATLSLFLLWTSTRLIGLDLFSELPEYVKDASRFLSSILASGAIISALLFYIRRQITGGTPTPAYIPYIIGVTAVLFVFVIGLAYIVPIIRDQATFHDNKTVEISSREIGDEEGTINISGPFFAAVSKEALGIKIKSTSVDLRTIYFSRGGIEIGRHEDYRIQNPAVCKFSENGRLGFLFYSWSGAASTPGLGVIAYYEKVTNRVLFREIFGGGQTETSYDENGPLIERDDGGTYAFTPTVACKGSQRTWIKAAENNGHFEPCECSFEKLVAVEALADELTSLTMNIDMSVDDFAEGKHKASEGALIEDGDLQEKIRYINQLGKASPFSMQSMASKQYEVVTITYNKPTSGSFQLFFARKKTDFYWRHVYTIYANSKSFNEIVLKDFVKDDNLLVDMCVEECWWWGKRSPAELDLSSMTFYAKGGSQE